MVHVLAVVDEPRHRDRAAGAHDRASARVPLEHHDIRGERCVGLDLDGDEALVVQEGEPPRPQKGQGIRCGCSHLIGGDGRGTLGAVPRNIAGRGDGIADVVAECSHQCCLVP